MFIARRLFTTLTDNITAKLSSALKPSYVNVIDQDGSNYMLTIVVVTDQFSGKRLVARQRMVNEQLKEFWDQGLHGTVLVTKTNEEWEKADKGEYQ